MAVAKEGGEREREREREREEKEELTTFGERERGAGSILVHFERGRELKGLWVRVE